MDNIDHLPTFDYVLSHIAYIQTEINVLLCITQICYQIYYFSTVFPTDTELVWILDFKQILLLLLLLLLVIAMSNYLIILV